MKMLTARRRLLHIGIMTIALVPGLVAFVACEDTKDVGEEIGDVADEALNTAEDIGNEGTSEPTSTPEDAEEAEDQAN